MNQTNLFDLEAGKAAKDDALAEQESCYAFPLEIVRDYAVRYARANSTVTIDNVRKWAAENGVDLPSAAWGSVFRKCPLANHRWLRVGYRPTELASSHARPVSVWALVAA